METKKTKPKSSGKKTIDESVLKKIFSQYVLVPKKQIVAWKAYLAIVFVGGFAAAFIMTAYNEWLTESQAFGPFGEVTLFSYAEKESHQAGDIFPLQILLDTSGKNIVAIQAVANYDPSLVEVLGVDNSISDFKYEVSKNVDVGNHQIFLAAAQPTPGILSHQAKVANVSLRALQPFKGSGMKLKFDSATAVSDSAAIADDGKGTNVLVKTAHVFDVADVDPAPVAETPPPVAETSTNVIVPVTPEVAVETASAKELKVSGAVSLTDNITKIVWEGKASQSAQVAVERKGQKEKDFREVARVSSSDFSYEDRSGLKDTYYYRICEVGADNSKVCAEPVKVKIQKKKTIVKPNPRVSLVDGKVQVTWSPHYTSDFRVFIQKKTKLLKSYKDITSISGNENSFIDENISAGEYLKYRLKVAAPGKKTITSKVVKIRVK